MWKLYFSYMFKHMRYVVALNLNVFLPGTFALCHYILHIFGYMSFTFLLSYIFSCSGILLNYLEGASVSSGGSTTGLS